MGSPRTGSEYTLLNIVVPCLLLVQGRGMKQIRQIKRRKASHPGSFGISFLCFKRKKRWPFEFIASECGCDAWNCSGLLEAMRRIYLNGILWDIMETLTKSTQETALTHSLFCEIVQFSSLFQPFWVGYPFKYSPDHHVPLAIQIEYRRHPCLQVKTF